MKNKYQRLNKDEKKEATKKYYETELGKENKLRIQRLLIYGILCIVYGIVLLIENIIKKGSVSTYVLAASVFIFGIIFLIGRYKVKVKQVNNYLTRKKK